MRLITVPLSMLLLLLTLGGCLAGGGHYGPSYGYGYGRKKSGKSNTN